MLVYLNGSLVPLKDARVSVLDHGFLYGDGIYETLRVYDGVVFMLREHLGRLWRSAELVGLDIPLDAQALEGAVYETLQGNGLRDAWLRITISRGPGPLGLDPALCSGATVFIYAEAFKPYPRQFYSQGVRAVLARTRRNLREAQDPRIKSLSFLNNILAKMEAVRAGAEEAFMLNHAGCLTEGTVSNLFFARDGVLFTPSVQCGLLDGITRQVVLSLARRLDVPVREDCFGAQELYAAREVFITSSTKEVMPVRQVDGTHYGVGELTKLLMAEFRKEVSAYVAEAKARGPPVWGYE